ncbi:MAG: COQ9 family protein [Pseudomonadota bacterium]
MSDPEHDTPQAMTPAPAAAAAEDALKAARERLLDHLPEHAVFDGWSRKAIDAAAQDAGVDREDARRAFPRGGVDAALAFHDRGDRRMAEALAREPLAGMGMTARVTRAVRLRLEIDAGHKEAVRRAANLLALPHHAADAAASVWRTAGAIWTALGDASEDLNWYSKRATLAGVISSTLLYWLQDESEGHVDTWAFLDRRIDDVMRIEKAKAAIRRNPLGRVMLDGADRVARGFRSPRGPDAHGGSVHVDR